MKEIITFFDNETGEKIPFEVVDALDLEGQRYLLVADQDNNAAILKETQVDDDDVTYELIEEDEEFQKVALSFLDSDSNYRLEF